jgi:hypothetical protein
VAINELCNLCDTLASAYQFVVQITTPVRLTKEGARSFREIEQALRDLEGSGLTAFEIQAKVQQQMDRLAEVLRTQLVPIKGTRDEQRGNLGGQPASSGVSTTTTTTAPSTTTTVTTTTSSSNGTTTTTTTTVSSSSSS